MNDIPTSMLVHTVTLEIVTARGSFGDAYADPIEVACFLRRRTQTLRDVDGGVLRVLYATITTLPEWFSAFTLGSRVTAGNFVGLVREVALNDDGGLGAWRHTYVRIEP